MINSTKGVDTNGNDANAIVTKNNNERLCINMSELRAIVNSEIETVDEELLLLIHAFILGLLSNKN